MDEFQSQVFSCSYSTIAALTPQTEISSPLLPSQSTLLAQDRQQQHQQPSPPPAQPPTSSLLSSPQSIEQFIQPKAESTREQNHKSSSSSFYRNQIKYLAHQFRHLNHQFNKHLKTGDSPINHRQRHNNNNKTKVNLIGNNTSIGNTSSTVSNSIVTDENNNIVTHSYSNHLIHNHSTTIINITTSNTDHNIINSNCSCGHCGNNNCNDNYLKDQTDIKLKDRNKEEPTTRVNTSQNKTKSQNNFSHTKGSLGNALYMPPPLAPIVKRLIQLTNELNNNIDALWKENAIKGLARRLKKDAVALDNLERALSSRSSSSRCVTLPRSLDGRLQILTKKGLPHVIFCQLWRWSDVHSHHQIKGIDSCRDSYYLKRRFVCINPFHYERASDQSTNSKETMVSINPDGHAGHDADLYSDLFSTPPADPAHMDFQPTRDVTYEMLPKPLKESPPPMTPDYGIEQQYFGHQSYAPPEELVDRTKEPSLVSSYVTLPHSASPLMYQSPLYWASIMYFELGQRVGEKYMATIDSFTVDGFTDPSNRERFCLGLLTNIHRDPTIEAVRKSIGKGIKIYQSQGEVFVECLSSCSVFIQSANCNSRYNWHPASVCKVPPGRTLKVFNYQDFGALLASSVSDDFEAVYDLAKMCSIRLSFVKGWGAEYRRREILNTPCWIEIQLNGPLQWLDRVLRQMGKPLAPCSSIS